LRRRFKSSVKELTFPVRFVDVALERSFPLGEAVETLEKSRVKAKIVDSGYAYHVAPIGVDKGRGLKTLLESLNIDAERVAAIGDSLQDLEMFNAVGFSVALANAPVELKKRADAVASKSYGEGFAEAVSIILKTFRKS
jgi:hypothetical protein